MKNIPLTKNLYSTVDDSDFEELSRYSWRALKGDGTFYAARSYRVNGHQKTMLMHRQILNAPKGIPVDHVINRDGLDNRRGNIRLRYK